MLYPTILITDDFGNELEVPYHVTGNETPFISGNNYFLDPGLSYDDAMTIDKEYCELFMRAFKKKLHKLSFTGLTALYDKNCFEELTDDELLELGIDNGLELLAQSKISELERNHPCNGC